MNTSLLTETYLQWQEWYVGVGIVMCPIVVYLFYSSIGIPIPLFRSLSRLFLFPSGA